MNGVGAHATTARMSFLMGKQTCPLHDFSIKTCSAGGLWWPWHHCLTCQEESNHMYVLQKPPSVYVEAGLRLMMCNLYIANMAHVDEANRPCFHPYIPWRLIIRSNMSNPIGSLFNLKFDLAPGIVVGGFRMYSIRQMCGKHRSTPTVAQSLQIVTRTVWNCCPFSVGAAVSYTTTNDRRSLQRQWWFASPVLQAPE